MTDQLQGAAPAPTVSTQTSEVCDRMIHMAVGMGVTALVSHGIVNHDQAGQASDLVFALIMAIVGVANLLASARASRVKQAQALNATPPNPPVKL